MRPPPHRRFGNHTRVTIYNNSGPVILQEVLSATTTRLSQAAISNASTEARWMVGHLARLSTTELCVRGSEEFPDSLKTRLSEMISARLAGHPLQYLLGFTEFYGRRLKCDPRALIPRPETEILVGSTLSYLNATFPPKNGLSPQVWDIGTGCGNIAISLAGERPDLELLATDIDRETLRLAWENVSAHQMENRISLVQGSLLAAVEAQPRFVAICANPPYVAVETKETLPREVRDFEPEGALFAPESGLAYLQAIIVEAHRHLVPGGLLALEIGFDQAGKVRAIFAGESSYTGLKLIPDLTGTLRVTTAVRV